MKYCLEFYEDRTALAVFESNTPFMAFNPGDIVNPVGFGIPELRSDVRYRVLHVEHIIWQVYELSHKLVVHTKMEFF